MSEALMRRSHAFYSAGGLAALLGIVVACHAYPFEPATNNKITPTAYAGSKPGAVPDSPSGGAPVSPAAFEEAAPGKPSAGPMKPGSGAPCCGTPTAAPVCCPPVPPTPPV